VRLLRHWTTASGVAKVIATLREPGRAGIHLVVVNRRERSTGGLRTVAPYCGYRNAEATLLEKGRDTDCLWRPDASRSRRNLNCHSVTSGRRVEKPSLVIFSMIHSRLWNGRRHLSAELVGVHWPRYRLSKRSAGYFAYISNQLIFHTDGQDLSFARVVWTGVCPRWCGEISVFVLWQSTEEQRIERDSRS